MQSERGILPEIVRSKEALLMNDMLVTLGRWQLDVKQVRERVYRAPTPRERERWHAVWLLADHLASWAGLAPGNYQSGGKHYSGRTTKGNRTLRTVMTQVAWA